MHFLCLSNVSHPLVACYADKHLEMPKAGDWGMNERTHDLESPFVLSYIALSPVKRHSRDTDDVSANSRGEEEEGRGGIGGPACTVR